MLKAPVSQSKDFEPAPAGNHVARCYKIVHIGTVLDTYMGEEKEMNKIYVTFELPNEKKEFKAGDGEKPWSVSREYTFSMGEKSNLRKLIEGMLGVVLDDEEAATFNIEDLLGRPCLLNVVHKKSQASGKTYTLIQGASPLPKGMNADAQVNASVMLDYGDNWNEDTFRSLPEFLRTKMEGSQEYKAKHGVEPGMRTAPEGEIGPDDIPF